MTRDRARPAALPRLLWRLLAVSMALACLAAPLGVRAAPPVPDKLVEDEPVLVPLLPDLRTVPPADLTIEFASGGRRLLRLANLVWNSGEGALELAGALSPATQQTLVIQ